MPTEQVGGVRSPRSGGGSPRSWAGVVLAPGSTEDDLKGVSARGGAPQPMPRRSPQPVQGARSSTVDPRGANVTVSRGTTTPADGTGMTLAAVPAALRRLESRLDAEKRHSEQQVHRLERRVEEVACASGAGGRWAELQGQVDYLAETMQGLLSRHEDQSIRAVGEPAVPHGNKGDKFNTETMAELESRLQRAERGLQEALSPLKTLGCLQEAVAGLAERIEVAEQKEQNGVAAGANHPMPPCLSSEAIDKGAQGRQIWEVDETGLLSDSELSAGDARIHEAPGANMLDLPAQVDGLNYRLDELEQGFKDLYQTQETREQMAHVGERRMLLAMKKQRTTADSWLQDGLRELRNSLSTVVEDLSLLWCRVQGAECGLERLCQALDRICEELARLRTAAAVQDDVVQDVEDVEAGENGATTPKAGSSNSNAASSRGISQPLRESIGELRRKVEEVERSLESMAEVVWGLRKQMNGGTRPSPQGKPPAGLRDLVAEDEET